MKDGHVPDAKLMTFYAAQKSDGLSDFVVHLKLIKISVMYPKP